MSISYENKTEIERPQTAERGSMTFKHTHRRKRKYDIQTHIQKKEEV